MSNQEVSTEISPDIINSLILTGDMSKLTSQQQTQYYTAVCKSVGINPITQPFAIITLQGKKTLYATKGCTQQLSDTRKINTEITKRETLDSVYSASCRATAPDGRYTDDDGIVSIQGLKGVELANAMMKAVTKAKRRAVLALCGLGMPDESEVEDIVSHPASQEKQDPTKSRLENIIDAQVDEGDPEEVKTEVIKKPKKVVSPTPAPTTPKTEWEKEDEYKKPLKIQAFITEIPIIRPVEKDGVTKDKYSFKIDDKYYGTFDEALFKSITDSIDRKVKVEFTYTIRTNEKGTLFQDIIGFREFHQEETPI